MKKQIGRMIPVLCLCLFSFFSANAAVTLHPLFCDHMVLQREKPLPVWGKANPGEKVSVTFNGETKTVETQADGRWMVHLSPQKVSTNPQVLKVRGSNELLISDVLVGDVWLGTGQSNMDFSVSGTDGQDRIKKSADGLYNGIRLFKVEQKIADKPVDEVVGKWQEPTRQNILGFSATLFFFAEALHERQPNVPLGLIRSSVGATNAFSWIPNQVRDEDPSTVYLRQWWANATRSWTPEKQAERDLANKEYTEKVAEYKARKEKMPESIKSPGELVGPMYSRRPSALYNGMIAPLQPLAIRGMIWYQGEWDAKSDWVKVYHDTFVALARSWRANWAKAGHDSKLGDFPVYIVQLPSRIPGDGDFWPFMREVEEKLATSVPNSAFVTTLDLNDGTDLHPKEKTEIGRRLALLALAKEYGQKISYRGPSLLSATYKGNQAVLTFTPGAKGLKSSDGEPLRNFELAGSDGRYFPAVAGIKKNTVVLFSKQVSKPVTVRYAWMPTPLKVNFFNTDGLPASPFRTDSQPVSPK
ncbi:MAG: sialate O-acetylesterase [Bacteroidales bacterium]|nr:sialate O-acetylesterase [Bacteroidales bacterium]